MSRGVHERLGAAAARAAFRQTVERAASAGGPYGERLRAAIAEISAS
ncbi:hypothetical protein ACIA5C_44215 [Actinoplanes sp. NPDC051343]